MPADDRFRLSGDEGVGQFEPADVHQPAFARLDAATLRRLMDVGGLSATASDVLDELGWQLAVPGHVVPARNGESRSVAGHAVTLAYLPARRTLAGTRGDGGPPKLAHHVAFRVAQAGDIVVIDGRGLDLSLLGGRAAAAALRAGIGGAVVDAGIRDLDDIHRLGFPVWARHVTPITGKLRAEAVAVNRPVTCAGVQVHPGDLVIADETGICFVPNQLAEAVAERIFEVAKLEAADIEP